MEKEKKSKEINEISNSIINDGEFSRISILKISEVVDSPDGSQNHQKGPRIDFRRVSGHFLVQGVKMASRGL